MQVDYSMHWVMHINDSCLMQSSFLLLITVIIIVEFVVLCAFLCLCSYLLTMHFLHCISYSFLPYFLVSVNHVTKNHHRLQYFNCIWHCVLVFIMWKPVQFKYPILNSSERCSTGWRWLCIIAWLQIFCSIFSVT